MENKVALITGASSGIGRATAELFSAKGASVVVAARRGAELEELVEEIQNRGGKASAIVADMSSSGDVEQMTAHVLKEYGRLDYAVNNAAIEGAFSPIVDLPEEEWDRVHDINLKGVFLCMKHQARAMLAAKQGGAIVNIGSVNSFLGFPTGAAYVSSKHALIGLTSSVSAELAPEGIRVNLVCPGIIDTPMHRRLRGIVGDAVYDQYAIPSIHLRRSGRSEEIAQTIAFLCSDEASYITGTTLTPDGGFSLTV
jgi:NAD(P)-dependent dehydrogenase (short-subunit alcohol dehydrogenase family)